MRTLLGDPLYRRHLEARGRTQCVVLGYSDANKESGTCASRYAIFRAQAELSAALSPPTSATSFSMRAAAASRAVAGGWIRWCAPRRPAP